MYPLNFYEFILGINDDKALISWEILANKNPIPEYMHEYLLNCFKHYLFVGGLPQIVKTYKELRHNLFSASIEIRKIQSSLFLSYHSDMSKHSGKIPAMHIQRFWDSIPTQLAKAQDSSTQRFIRTT